MVDIELKTKVLKKQHEIMRLLDGMIDNALGVAPVPQDYYVEAIQTQVKLLARILKERG